MYTKQEQRKKLINIHNNHKLHLSHYSKPHTNIRNADRATSQPQSTAAAALLSTNTVCDVIDRHFQWLKWQQF